MDGGNTAQKQRSNSGDKFTLWGHREGGKCDAEVRCDCKLILPVVSKGVRVWYDQLRGPDRG